MTQNIFVCPVCGSQEFGDGDIDLAFRCYKCHAYFNFPLTKLEYDAADDDWDDNEDKEII